MTVSDPLEAEYRALLERRGVGHLAARPTPEQINALIDRLEMGEKDLHADLIRSIRRGDYSVLHQNPYDGIRTDLLHTLQLSGIELPGPVYVGEYPHNSFNAQACVVPGGTLILVNTGLMTLLFQVAKLVGASFRTFTRTEDAGMQFEEETAEMIRQWDRARKTVAKAVVAYIFHGDARRAGRIPVDADSRALLGVPLAGAARDFVVGHEFGHFLAGHLHEPAARTRSGEWIRKSHQQEFEADEIGALLMLRRLENPGDQIQKNFAVAGPFLFFAIDHLVTRVRNEINDIPAGLIVTDHPPSDERAAALRRLFVEIEGPGVVQFANAFVSVLSAQENDILDFVDSLLHTASG
ncbi:hypothetical protein [Streptomyces bicolor]|uniref:hypothetical protein n=1 Tax=Streptomyces bicolor TaxID=66874 RepID=UPI00131E63FA|nr:hypothetical protein [Streptomyces bicolor]